MDSLTIAAVTKAFPAKPTPHLALAGIDLLVQPGELFFLLGASGCGKTTLLRCIAGLETPTSGTIRFGERDVTALPPHLREAALVFQNYALWPHLSVRQNVAFGLVERRVPAAEITRRVDEALASVRMAELAERGVDQISGGQQQRVALARALVVRPRILLLDEPLSNLDAQLRVEMRREIRRIVKSHGLTAIYVTHDQEEALAMADRIAVLDRGRIAQVGTPESVYRLPRTSHVATFIGETNLLRGNVVSREDGDIEVATAGGLLLGRAADPTWKPSPGQAVSVSIRPECWSLGLSDGPNATEALVLDNVYLGQRCQLTVATPLGNLSVVLLNPDRPTPIGSTLRLVARPTEVVVLPAP